MSWTFHIEPEERTYEIFLQSEGKKVRVGKISCNKGRVVMLDLEKVHLCLGALKALIDGLTSIHSAFSADFGPEAR